MSLQQVTVNSRKYDQSIRKSWKCELLERNDPLLVFVGKFDQDVKHPGLGSICSGTISYEYYWLDRWYNVFRFHEPDGAFRNFYCNINMPPVFENGVLDYVDLDLDVLIWPDLRYEILDRDDFERNSVKYNYAEAVRVKALECLGELMRMIEKREFPFLEIDDLPISNLRFEI